MSQNNPEDLVAFFDRLQALEDETSPMQFEVAGEDFEVMVDPATIEMIITAAGFVLSLFTGGDNSAALAEALKRISDQLDHVNRLLSDVLKKLDDLKVLIQHVPVDIALANLLSILNVCRIHLPEWDANQRSADIQREVRGFLLQLETSVGTCMQYGYATYNTVGFAMRFEAALLKIVKTDVPTKTRAIGQYKTFFLAQLNTALSGTVANVRLEYEERAKLLASQFTAKRESLGHVKWAINNCCTGHADVFRVITGSISQGFSGEIVLENREENCKGFHCNGPRFARSARFGQDPDLTRYENEKNSLIAVYNNAHSEFEESLARAGVLKQAEAQITKLAALAKDLMDNIS